MLRIFKYIFLFSAFFFALFYFYLTPKLLLKGLVAQIKDAPEHCQESVSSIVVLGSGVTNDGLPSATGLIRTARLVELLKSSPQRSQWIEEQTPVLFSGGRTNPKSSVSEASAMQKYASEFGSTHVKKFNFMLEEQSQSTFENARFTKKILDELALPPHVALVTSLFHMARAQLLFEKMGMTVCPVPAVSLDGQDQETFSASYGALNKRLLHEYFGLLRARFTAP